MISLLLGLFHVFALNKSVTDSYCDIKGNVNNPGVYLVEKGDVINDIIKKAGGLKKNSYVKNINLSKKVEDEMVINILSISDYKNLTYTCPKCECPEIHCNKIAETTTTLKIPTTTITKEITTLPTTTLKTTTESLIININTASLEELTKLSGIGQVVAQNIIDYRNNTPFETIEDILNVKGIGEKLFAKIKNYITV